MKTVNIQKNRQFQYLSHEMGGEKCPNNITQRKRNIKWLNVTIKLYSSHKIMHFFLNSSYRVFHWERSIL